MVSKKRGKGLIFKNKNAISHEIFFNVFELVLASLIAMALFLFISDVAEKTIFEKNYLTRDLALVINTIYAAPGEVIYNYEEDTSKFIIDFTENKVSVSRKKDEADAKIFYLFAEDKKKPFRHKTISVDEDSNKIRFLKSNDFLDVDKTEILTSNKESSSETTSTNKNDDEK